jgi:hypothetical protein
MGSGAELIGAFASARILDDPHKVVRILPQGLASSFFSTTFFANL